MNTVPDVRILSVIDKKQYGKKVYKPFLPYCSECSLLVIITLYRSIFHAMIKPLGKRISNVSKAEPRSLLPSSTDVARGSTLGLSDQETPIDVLIDQLAEILVEAYFYEKRNKRGAK